jgi:outer membrane protein, heavy metal efflux system
MPMFNNMHKICLLAFSISFIANNANANNMQELFNQAWPKNAINKSYNSTNLAISAKHRNDQGWLAETPSLEISTKNSMLINDSGMRNIEAAISLPLNLKNEKAATRNLSIAEISALRYQKSLAALELSGEVRARYWQFILVQQELSVINKKLANMQKIAEDTAKRLRAGDIAKSDYTQAQANVYNAQALHIEATAKLNQAKNDMLGMGIDINVQDKFEEESNISAADISVDMLNYISNHPLYAAIQANKTLVNKQNILSMLKALNVQKPELKIGLSYERSSFSEKFGTVAMVGIKIPLSKISSKLSFGGFNNNLNNNLRAATMQTKSDQEQASANLELMQQKLQVNIQSSLDKIKSSTDIHNKYKQQYALQQQNLALFEKSFKVGQTDLASLLRMQQQNFELEMALTKSNIEQYMAVSELRQALGLAFETDSNTINKDKNNEKQK